MICDYCKDGTPRDGNHHHYEDPEGIEGICVVPCSDWLEVERAFDNLGGMWSWYDESITREPNYPGGLNETWYVFAGRILRQVVGRPAKDPWTK